MSNDLTNYLVSISKGDVEMTMKDHALLKTLRMDGMLETKEDLTTDAVTDEDRVKTRVFEHATAGSGAVSQKSRFSPRRVGLFGLLAILLAGSAYGGYILYKRYYSSQPAPTAAKEGRLIPFRKGDKFGYCDENKKLVIEAKYDNARPFSEGLAIVNMGRKGDLLKGDVIYGKTGAIDYTGKEVIPLKYDSITDFKNGLAYVGVDTVPTKFPKAPSSKLGVIDKSGREIVPPQYDEIGKFVDGFAMVKLNGKLGYINEKGTVVVPLTYGVPGSENGDFSAGLAAVNKGGQEYISDPRPDSGRRESIRPIKGKYGYIDMAGQEVIPFKFDYAGRFSTDTDVETHRALAAVAMEKKCGYIDSKGEFKIPPKYADCRSFSEGFASVSANGGKWGFIDTNGNEVISPKYDEAYEFHEGLAGVAIGQALGFINKAGEEVITTKYGYARKFDKGMALTCLATDEFMPEATNVPKMKCGFIDKNGNEVIALKYDSNYVVYGLGVFTGDFALVSLDDKLFYIDRNGVEYYEP